MAIKTKFGTEVQIASKPDKKGFVVVRLGKMLREFHISDLRATRGFEEIEEAIGQVPSCAIDEQISSQD